ncbi:hypothetical protein [uncultured Akkermansia sp.]|uniref:hypothetical protein n=1 Tax=uncultured Akkermansia sp. TaxID=512294 RepID=UPI0026383617|nr:hypothetical protein [uncultured Akkermansia sp.]
MKLLNEYLLLPSLETGQMEWLKLELYFDQKSGYIYPKLYARDKFLVKRDINKTKETKEWLWFEECGWFFPLDSYILTGSETEALNVVKQYIECKWNGNNIPINIINKIKESTC